jgi:uncharacterized protein
VCWCASADFAAFCTISVHFKATGALRWLLDGGATVPFIARYRKEATGGLDDIQLRELEYRLGYLRELEERRAAILKSIDEQGKLTPELRAAIEAAPTKQELEDLYLPYKPKRRTKGMIAREAGIEPLADRLFADPTLDPARGRRLYVPPPAAWKARTFPPCRRAGRRARHPVRALGRRRRAGAALREWLWAEGLLRSKLAAGKDENHPDVAKFRDYFDYDEPIGRVPSHRALAVFRGRTLEILDAKLVLPEAVLPGSPEPGPRAQAARRALTGRRPHRAAPGLEPPGPRGRRPAAQVRGLDLARQAQPVHRARPVHPPARRRREGGDQGLCRQPARPAAGRAGRPAVVMGLDPGIRTGVKVAVVDATGKLVDTATVYPHEPRKDWDGSLHTLARLCEKHHGVNLIAIGNGTASRETDRLAADLMKLMQKAAIPIAEWSPPAMQKIVVSEAGASVYSASEYASQELPDVDVSLRGAASIARRLQDPLAELVKIDPKSIGVGQYQHDVNQGELARTLDAVVEDCVNGVGVDLNTASVPLLTRVSGLSGSVAAPWCAGARRTARFATASSCWMWPAWAPRPSSRARAFCASAAATTRWT